MTTQGTGQVEAMEIVAKWSGQEYTLTVLPTETVQHLKTKLQNATKVLPKRQKLIGLGAKGKMPEDEVKHTIWHRLCTLWLI